MKEELNSRETILSCALGLFYRKGYDGAGIAEITREAGITKPTLYYFFGSKEGLFQALLESRCNMLLDALAAAAVYEPQPTDYHKDVFPVLKRVALAFFAFAQTHAEFYRLFVSLSFSPPESAQTRCALPFFAAQYRIMSSLFTAIAAVHGNLRGKQELLARLFVAAVNAEIAFWGYRAAELTEKTAERLVKSFMHGIFS